MPNEALTSSCTTHSTTLETTESARLRAYNSPPRSPANTSAMTMTATRTMDSGSLKIFLNFACNDESSCGVDGGPGA